MASNGFGNYSGIMVNVDNFDNDYDTGHSVEIEVLKYLQKKYKSARLIAGYHPQFDIEIPEVNETVEVKYDKKASKTENLFFETDFKAPNSEKRPAGVNVTTCTWWIHVDDTYYYFISFENLDYLIHEGLRDGSVRHIKTGGKDGTEVWGYITPRSHMEFSPYVTTVKRPS